MKLLLQAWCSQIPHFVVSAPAQLKGLTVQFNLNGLDQTMELTQEQNEVLLRDETVLLQSGYTSYALRRHLE